MNRVCKSLLVAVMAFLVSQPLCAMESNVLGTRDNGRELQHPSASPQSSARRLPESFTMALVSAPADTVDMASILSFSNFFNVQKENDNKENVVRDVFFSDTESALASSEVRRPVAGQLRISKIDASIWPFLSNYIRARVDLPVQSQGSVIDESVQQFLVYHSELQQKYEENEARVRELQAKAHLYKQRLTTLEQEKKEKATHVAQLLARHTEVVAGLTRKCSHCHECEPRYESE